MEEVLGLVMIVSWVWSVVIIARKTKETTSTEKGVLGVGLVTIALFIIGAMM